MTRGAFNGTDTNAAANGEPESSPVWRHRGDWTADVAVKSWEGDVDVGVVP